MQRDAPGTSLRLRAGLQFDQAQPGEVERTGRKFNPADKLA